MNRIAKPAFTALCVAAAALVVLMILVPAVFGLQRYVITGRSMTGTIAKGSVVYSRLTPVGQLKVGDIITFVPPGSTGTVTHRIVSIEQSDTGQRVFRTKGDFNKATDPLLVTFPQPRQARYVFHIPVLGYVLAVLSIRLVRLLLIGLPALAIAISLLWSLWRSTDEELRTQEAARRGAAMPSAPQKTRS
jgi:signal peptidase